MKVNFVHIHVATCSYVYMYSVGGSQCFHIVCCRMSILICRLILCFRYIMVKHTGTLHYCLISSGEYEERERAGERERERERGGVGDRGERDM
jgi:hypothetical protein